MKTLLLIILVGLGGSLSLPAAVRFDGSDDVLHWDAAPSGLNFTNVITVSIWYTQEAGNTTAAELIGKGRLKNGNNSHWQIRGNAGKLEFYYTNPSATFRIWSTTASTYATPTNVWIHMAFRHDWAASNTATMFINGARAAGAWSSGAANTTGLTNPEPFRIGTTYAGSTWRGQAAEAAVWNALLNDNEIAALAKSRTRGTPLRIRRPMLRGYWPLDRPFPYFTTASGSNAVLDLSGYGQHLTPLNSPQARPGHLHAP
jgi:hypothetical protein